MPISLRPKDGLQAITVRCEKTFAFTSVQRYKGVELSIWSIGKNFDFYGELAPGQMWANLPKPIVVHYLQSNLTHRCLKGP